MISPFRSHVHSRRWIRQLVSQKIRSIFVLCGRYKLADVTQYGRASFSWSKSNILIEKRKESVLVLKPIPSSTATPISY